MAVYLQNPTVQNMVLYGFVACYPFIQFRERINPEGSWILSGKAMIYDDAQWENGGFPLNSSNKTICLVWDVVRNKRLVE